MFVCGTGVVTKRKAALEVFFLIRESRSEEWLFLWFFLCRTKEALLFVTKQTPFKIKKH